MSLSVTQIYNMALGDCPADRIDAPDDGSFEAEACNTHYQPALELLLEDHDWDFAVIRSTLAELTNDRADEWGFAYALPSGMARPRYILPPASGSTTAAIENGFDPEAVLLVTTASKYWMGRLAGYEGAVDYRIADSKLYTSISGAVLEYVTNAPSEAVFTAKFARALGAELASRIVMPILKDRARQQELLKAAEIMRERAKAADMNRDPETTYDFISEVQAARMGMLPGLRRY